MFPDFGSVKSCFACGNIGFRIRFGVSYCSNFEGRVRPHVIRKCLCGHEWREKCAGDSKSQLDKQKPGLISHWPISFKRRMKGGTNVSTYCKV